MANPINNLGPAPQGDVGAPQPDQVREVQLLMLKNAGRLAYRRGYSETQTNRLFLQILTGAAYVVTHHPWVVENHVFRKHPKRDGG